MDRAGIVDSIDERPEGKELFFEFTRDGFLSLLR